jgi:hypothetical protein
VQPGSLDLLASAGVAGFAKVLLISVAANAIERCFICAFGGTNLNRISSQRNWRVQGRFLFQDKRAPAELVPGSNSGATTMARLIFVAAVVLSTSASAAPSLTWPVSEAYLSCRMVLHRSQRETLASLGSHQAHEPRMPIF